MRQNIYIAFKSDDGYICIQRNKIFKMVQNVEIVLFHKKNMNNFFFKIFL